MAPGVLMDGRPNTERIADNEFLVQVLLPMLRNSVRCGGLLGHQISLHLMIRSQDELPPCELCFQALAQNGIASSVYQINLREGAIEIIQKSDFESSTPGLPIADIIDIKSKGDVTKARIMRLVDRASCECLVFNGAAGK